LQPRTEAAITTAETVLSASRSLERAGAKLRSEAGMFLAKVAA
jgi:hypothetical protein